jgi:predicted O-methyltransferase YrrM
LAVIPNICPFSPATVLGSHAERQRRVGVIIWPRPCCGRSSAARGQEKHRSAPNQGKLLMMLTQAIGARRILEIGTLGGYSTIWLARGLPSGGRLITLEANADYAKVARANIERVQLAEIVDLRVGRALEKLPELAAEDQGPFDLIFIDAES